MCSTEVSQGRRVRRADGTPEWREVFGRVVSRVKDSDNPRAETVILVLTSWLQRPHLP
jgi:hypothetical protein